MFENFIAEGNLLAVVLMTYASNVGIEIAIIERSPESVKMNAPLIVRGALATLFMFISLCGSFWASIYIGLYDGWLAGIASWFLIQIFGAIISVVLRIRGSAIAFHFMAGVISCAAGYYLSITSLQ